MLVVARLAAGVACLACAAATGVATTRNEAAPTCVSVPATGARPESLVVAIATGAGALAPAAPLAVFDGLAFESLLTLDCDHRLRPGLARIVSGSGHGGVTLQLRAGATFWSGEPASAAAVVDGWRLGGDPVARRVARSARIIDDRTLHLDLPDDDASVLAEPALAVRRDVPGARWGEGTGAYRVIENSAAARARPTLRLVPVRDPSLPAILVRVAGADDGRDLVDAGFDLLLAEDTTLAAYASRTAGRTAILPWGRVVALLVPDGRGVSPAALPDSTRRRLTRALRESLARDVLHAEARPAGDLARVVQGDCLVAAPSDGVLPSGQEVFPAGRRAAERGGPRVVYAAGDGMSRAIAERLVALAAMGVGGSDATRGLAVAAPALATAGRSLRAVGLDHAAFVGALAAGDEAGYVIALDGKPSGDVPARATEAPGSLPCAVVRRLAMDAPWLGTAQDSTGPSVVPLVDTRIRAVVRGGAVGVRLDGFGRPHPVWPAERRP